MRRNTSLSGTISVLPQDQQQWLWRFLRHDIREVNIADPDLEPEKEVRGFYGRTLAGAMIASEALRNGTRDVLSQADALLRGSAAKKAAPAIETGLVEMRAFRAASDAAYRAGLRNVAFEVDCAVLKAAADNNPSVARAKAEAEFRPELDIALVKELVEMPVDRIVLLTETQAVERAAMAMSYVAALYAEYFGVLPHLASRGFGEWALYAPVVEQFWNLFKKGYVVLGTALPAEAGEGGILGNTYVCAKLRPTDAPRDGPLLEISGRD